MQAVAAANATWNAGSFRLRPTAWLRRHAEAVRRRIRHRQNMMVLVQLDDHLLQDIGLCRCDLPYAPAC